MGCHLGTLRGSGSAWDVGVKARLNSEDRPRVL